MTNSDIRLQTSWYSNLKRKKLQRRLGGAGTTAFIDLLIYVGVNNPDGDLSEFTDEDIEAAAQWDGTDGEFIRTIRDLRFIDGEPGSYRIHDWEENNPWACGAKRRSEAARIANRVRWGSEPDASRFRTGSEPDASRSRTGIPPSVSVSVSDSSPIPEETNLPSNPDGGKKKAGKPKKKRLPIEERKANTPGQKLVKYWHVRYLAIHGTHYSGDIVKMGGQIATLLRRPHSMEDLACAMNYLLSEHEHGKFHKHNFDHFVKKASDYIIEAKEAGYVYDSG